jgi:hypothetical protein
MTSFESSGAYPEHIESTGRVREMLSYAVHILTGPHVLSERSDHFPRRQQPLQQFEDIQSVDAA